MNTCACRSRHAGAVGDEARRAAVPHVPASAAVPGHIVSHRLRLRPLGVQVSSFRTRAAVTLRGLTGSIYIEADIHVESEDVMCLEAHPYLYMTLELDQPGSKGTPFATNAQCRRATAGGSASAAGTLQPSPSAWRLLAHPEPRPQPSSPRTSPPRPAQRGVPAAVVVTGTATMLCQWPM